jgi:hypothetical protein
VTDTSTLKGIASLAAQRNGDSDVKGHIAELVRSRSAEPLRAHRALPDEQSWLTTRLLLLMNASDSITRRNAAESLGDLIERGQVPFDAELSATTLFLAQRENVAERVGAAHALCAWFGESNGMKKGQRPR